MNYRSSSTLFGLPLVDIAVGQVVDGRYQRGVARGWVAVGDVSYGLLSVGGVAYGGVAIGGLACGLIALGGLAGGLIALGGVAAGLASLGGVAVGVYAVGGMAVGIFALGGLAIAGYAAHGGVAVATVYASGGVAVAQHANDEAARSYLGTDLMRAGTGVLDQIPWVVLLAVMISLLTLVPALTRHKPGRRGRHENR